jgi:hypothetical protein
VYLIKSITASIKLWLFMTKMRIRL